MNNFELGSLLFAVAAAFAIDLSIWIYTRAFLKDGSKIISYRKFFSERIGTVLLVFVAIMIILLPSFKPLIPRVIFSSTIMLIYLALTYKYFSNSD